jgi:trk/ktr system potassium uptake protein
MRTHSDAEEHTMKVMVIGCGRVGSALAMRYAKAGHEVSVVDEVEEAREHLGADFTGRFLKGAGLDINVLKKAGIESMDACLVATDGDNTNLVVSQIAREQFGVPCVVARVFDPGRAEFYSGRGFRVVCPVSLAVEEMHAAVCAYEGGGEA